MTEQVLEPVETAVRRRGDDRAERTADGAQLRLSPTTAGPEPESRCARELLRALDGPAALAAPDAGRRPLGARLPLLAAASTSGCSTTCCTWATAAGPRRSSSSSTTASRCSSCSRIVVFGVGVVRSFFSPERTRALLHGRREATGNVMAASLGIVTPFCSCSAVPLFIGFVEAGIPLGVTFSFLIAAPMVNEIALVLLYGMFGLRGRRPLPRHRPHHRHGRRLGHRAPQDGALHRGLGARDQDGRRRRPQASDLSWAARVSYAWQAVKDIVGRVWPWVLAGIAVGALIHGYVPRELHGRRSWAPAPGGACRSPCCSASPCTRTPPASSPSCRRCSRRAPRSAPCSPS